MTKPKEGCQLPLGLTQAELEKQISQLSFNHCNTKMPVGLNIPRWYNKDMLDC